MKRIDLHTHAKLSKSFPFTTRAVWQFVAQAGRLGLDGVALVEHFHATDYWNIHGALRREFPYRDADGVYEGPQGMRLLAGVELSIREGCDLIVLGRVEQIRALDAGLSEPATTGYRPSFDEAVAVVHRVGAFVIGAHMFRPGKELWRLGRRLAVLDALEFNGKDFSADDRVRAAAREYGVPVVAGSDAHFWAQVGIKATLLPIDEITQASVTSAIREHRAAAESQSYGPLAVQISAAYKRIAKARRARAELAGTYMRPTASSVVSLSEAASRVR
ncbi:MAG TPA: PHP-associated domain-containing protein [bacterium]|nr:PHP-associated domain-containing protein [bacterium]